MRSFELCYSKKRTLRHELMRIGSHCSILIEKVMKPQFVCWFANSANIEAKDEVNWTAVQYATMNDHEGSVCLLLANGANIDAQDSPYAALH